MHYFFALAFVWSLSLAQTINVGQLMMLSFTGDTTPLAQLEEFKPAGFTFYRNNITSTENTRIITQALQQHATYPLLFSITQEGGPFNAYRVDTATLFPSPMALAATQNPDLAARVAYAIGKELRYMGFNLLFAPVMDVNSNPDNPIIGVRSFAADAETVSTFGKAFLLGLEQAGIAGAAKHFPGHGDTSTDSHLGLPVVTGNLEHLYENELAPFKSSIEAGVPAIMTAHVVFPALGETLPATLSKSVLTDILRNELGFQGLIVTDSLEMKAITESFGAGEAAVRSIEAGADLLLLGSDINKQREVYVALKQALESGRLSEERVRDAIARSQTIATTYISDWNTLPDYAAHQDLAKEVAIKAITLLYNDGVLPLKPDVKILVLAPRLMQYGEPPLFGDVLAQYHSHINSKRIAEQPTEKDIREALELSITADIIILASHHWEGPFAKSLASLESKLMATGKPVVVVALGNPDDLRFFDKSPNAYLATYGFWEADLDAATRVLTGQIIPKGKLPMPVGDIPVGSGVNGF